MEKKMTALFLIWFNLEKSAEISLQLAGVTLKMLTA